MATAEIRLKFGNILLSRLAGKEHYASNQWEFFYEAPTGEKIEARLPTQNKLLAFRFDYHLNNNNGCCQRSARTEMPICA